MSSAWDKEQRRVDRENKRVIDERIERDKLKKFFSSTNYNPTLRGFTIESPITTSHSKR